MWWERLKWQAEVVKKVWKEVSQSGLALFLSSVEFDLLSSWNEVVPSFRLCAFLSLVYMSSLKVGRSCLALPFEVEVRHRRNEWLLLVSTVGLFVEGDAEASPLTVVGLALVTVACFFLSHEPPTLSDNFLPLSVFRRKKEGCSWSRSPPDGRVDCWTCNSGRSSPFESRQPSEKREHRNFYARWKSKRGTNCRKSHSGRGFLRVSVWSQWSGNYAFLGRLLHGAGTRLFSIPIYGQIYAVNSTVRRGLQALCKERIDTQDMPDVRPGHVAASCAKGGCKNLHAAGEGKWNQQRSSWQCGRIAGVVRVGRERWQEVINQPKRRTKTKENNSYVTNECGKQPTLELQDNRQCAGSMGERTAGHVMIEGISPHSCVWNLNARPAPKKFEAATCEQVKHSGW